MTRARDTADTQDNLGGAVPPFVAGKNKIINGDFNVNQRAFTSSTNPVGAYSFDRWANVVLGTSGSGTFSAETFTPGAAPVAGYESTNFLRIVTTGQTTTDTLTLFRQPIEDVRVLAGQTATISFWAKAASGTPKVAISWAQLFGSGGSPSANTEAPVGFVTISTNWVRYSLTYAVPSISGKTIGTTATTSSSRIQFFLSAGSNFAVNSSSIGIQTNTFDIWGVQVEAGSVATPFQTATGSIGGELALCQRYYYRAADASSTFGSVGLGMASSTTASAIWTQFPVSMRVKPGSVDFSDLILSDAVGTVTVTALTIDSNVTSISTGATTVSGTGQTQYRPMYLRQNSSTAGYIAFSAEL
jgi:hypothetical protein